MKTKLLLILVAVVVSFQTAFADSFTSHVRVNIGDLYYNLNDDNRTAEVTSQSANSPYWTTSPTTVNIPSSVLYGGKTYAVIRIGDSAFESCENLSSVTIPNGIVSIGSWAFMNNTNLSTLTIPSSVSLIEGGTFKGCSNLSSITCEATNPPSCPLAYPFPSTTIPVYVPENSVQAYKNADGWKDFTNIQAIPTIKTYDLWINGTQITDQNCSNIASTISGVSGTVSYDATTSTLTMQNATITAPTKKYAIQSAIRNLTIKVLGNNTINSANDWSGIRLDKRATINGGGKLTIDAKGEGIGIYIFNKDDAQLIEDISLSIEGTEVYAKGLSGIAGYGSQLSLSKTFGAVLSVTNSKVTAEFNNYTAGLGDTRKGGALEYLHALNFDGVRIVDPRNVKVKPKQMENVVSATDANAIINKVVIDKPVTYGIELNGVKIDEINCTDIASDIDGVSGTVSFDPSTTTLTMQDASINAVKAYAIQNSIPDLKIKVLGTNTINGDKDWSGIRLNKNTEITGGGNLSVKTTGAGIGIFIYNTNEIDLTENITLSVTGGTELYAEGMSGISGYGGSASMSRTYGAVLSVTDSRVTAAFHGNTSVLNSGRKGGGIEYLHALNLDGVEIISPRNVTFVPKTMSNIVDVADNTLVLNKVAINKAYVDLGLSSGTLWATFNVGANAPEDYGDYFAWGEIAPVSNYDWTNYTHADGAGKLKKYCNMSQKGYNDFTDELTILVPEDDAATANVGAEWCIPTQEQCLELFSQCYCVLTEDYEGKGVKGYIVYRSINKSIDYGITKGSDHEYSLSTDAHIFLPFAGRYVDGTDINNANLGGYWSSSLNNVNPISAKCLLLAGNGLLNDTGNRYLGRTVRAVKAQNYTITITQPANGSIRVVEQDINLADVRERTELHFVAEAGENYEFDSWNGCSENGYLIVTGDATVTCSFKQKQQPTSVKNIGTAAPKVSKVLENGTMYIIKGGVKYNLQGVKCEGE